MKNSKNAAGEQKRDAQEHQRSSVDSIYIQTQGNSNFIEFNDKTFQNIKTIMVKDSVSGTLIQKGGKNSINVSVKNRKGSSIIVRQSGQNNRATIRQNSGVERKQGDQ
ncbi:hypothetical protein [Cyclobacterium lianum]|uniref:hypothetical protein n=1 Tax=Cyclobacterium lianum TaxID=388280 RepID=UPI0011604024|nr:hypothetical protein [Cyclobacterium lianum]